MAKTASIEAIASPEKRLFISLLTRDISLIDAVLDLIDNCINSAIIISRTELEDPSDYIALLEKRTKANLPTIDITFDEQGFSIEDTCGGISLEQAEKNVFRFGRFSPDDKVDNEDRLSVYGIGLKRAMFKIGDHIQMVSAHSEDGFNLDFHVKKWERTLQDKWTIPIQRYRGKINGGYGTKIKIDDLVPDIRKRISDGAFEGELIRRIARSYNYFLQRIVKISVNRKTVEPVDLQFGKNTASQSFVLNAVSCSILAGIGIPSGKFHVADVAGWYIFCNGRAIAFAEKTELTGWGSFLPKFQPKHRPFIGLVFFTSDQPENLPWTTTKSSINQDSAVWQHALRVMGTVGKQITSYLDSRYSDDGTEITTDELAKVAGKAESALGAITHGSRTFKVSRGKKDTTSIQFTVKISQVNEVKSYLGKKTMSNGEVGRHTFDYFLENVVRE
jgi:hypothetical protein